MKLGEFKIFGSQLVGCRPVDEEIVQKSKLDDIEYTIKIKKSGGKQEKLKEMYLNSIFNQAQ